MSESATSIYQLRLVLRHVTPLVWRRILVPSDTTIAHLHHIVQIAMGWEDIHLHRFRIHGKEYGSGSTGVSFATDPQAVSLASLRLRLRERFAYHYDFIACWQLDIRLEQILPPNPAWTSPRCIGGKHACPPEDCAGPDDYRARVQERASLAALNDLALVADFVGRWLEHDVRGTEDEHAEVQRALERMADRQGLDPAHFDRRAVNVALKQLSEAAIHRM